MALTDMFVRQAKATGKDYTIPDFDGLSLAVSDKGTNPQRQREKDRRIATQAEQNTFEAVYDNWLAFRAQGRLKKGRQTTLSMIPRIFRTTYCRACASVRSMILPASTYSKSSAASRSVVRRPSPRRCAPGSTNSYRYALVIVPGLEQNPASDLDVVAIPPPPVRHNPFLRMPDLAEFLQLLRKYPGKLKTQLGIRLLLLTGVRTGKLCRAYAGDHQQQTDWTPCRA